jgi:hypothetical protein
MLIEKQSRDLTKYIDIPTDLEKINESRKRRVCNELVQVFSRNV